jgi:hypothetical protein
MIFSKTILFIYIILSLSSCSYTHTRTPEGNELTSDFVEGLKITEGWINDLQKENKEGLIKKKNKKEQRAKML